MSHVSSFNGSSGQITSSSLPAGNLSVTGTITSSGAITATAGGVTATAGGVTATAGNITATNGDVVISTAGQGLQVKTGSNATAGTAVANGTTAVTVSTTAVTANSLIFLGGNTPAGTPSAPYVFAVTPGTSFQFKAGASDTSTIAWFIVEPAA